MYAYTSFDRQFVTARAQQYRDQLERWQAGLLSDEAFKPLRLQNGWYIQRHAPMLRVAIPYGELCSAQLRVLARIAREYDQPTTQALEAAQAQQDRLGPSGAPLRAGLAHFTTRQNVQFNWIAIERSADVMDLLAAADLHGIQTSGNCIRNITSDELAGIAVDEIADPRPYAEVLRQWSTLHPEFAFLPRKFKVAITGARNDRAATAWHDVGLYLLRSASGELGFKVLAGGGMGRTPLTGTVVREFLPWHQLLNFMEAVVRVYNRWGRRDNLYKARLKILLKAEGQRYIDEVEQEYGQIMAIDGGQHTLTTAEIERVAASFAAPVQPHSDAGSLARSAAVLERTSAQEPQFASWLKHNVAEHQNPELAAVTLSFKRLGLAPGDATADQLDALALLCEQFSAGKARVTHKQNLLLPWVRKDQLPELWRRARELGLARPNIGLLTDMIACPGGDYCALANARSIPIAQSISERYQDLDELHDIGPIDLHISGCINSCGHHHSGHIGVLGVDKDGQEWYQVSIGGSDGSARGGPASAGKIVGPSFAAAEVADAVEALIETYCHHRQAGECFIACVQRVGHDPFRLATHAARQITASATP
jgi:sulfite reductase (NADPH) hemoprotein beta-component